MRSAEQRRSFLACIIGSIVGMAAPSWAQPCRPFWTIGPPTVSNSAQDFLGFDDGSGPALYGIWNSFQIKRWRSGDTQWTSIQAGLPPAQFFYDFLVLDDGSGPRLAVEGAGAGLWMARWNGAQWEQAWPGMATAFSTPLISADLGDGPAVYGMRAVTGGILEICRWVEDHWQPLGSPTNGQTFIHLAALDDGQGPKLYATGQFTQIGGVPCPTRFARWNGTAWEPLGIALSVYPRQLIVYDSGSGPKLYMMGTLSPNGSAFVEGIHRWSGTDWETVGVPGPTGVEFSEMHVFDDGRGPGLYLAGSFSQFGGVQTNGVVRYNGQSWEALGAGLSSASFWLASMPTPEGPSLFVLGGSTMAGGGVTNGMARWIGCPNCYANCDSSTTAPRLNVRDFMCFINKFAVQDPYANCTVDAAIDVADFSCFLNKFAAGCP